MGDSLRFEGSPGKLLNGAGRESSIYLVHIEVNAMLMLVNTYRGTLEKLLFF